MAWRSVVTLSDLVVHIYPTLGKTGEEVGLIPSRAGPGRALPLAFPVTLVVV